MTRRAAAFLLLLAPLRADQFERIRALIRSQITEYQIPSVAVAVAHDRDILWEEGFGWANREKRIPAGPHTMYSLASISKPFTATGLMVLKEQGRIDLDQPINRYLGDAKITGRAGKGEDATVRRVANHSAGLPLHYQFFYQDEPYQKPSMDETIRRYANLVTAPGERYEYSNLGYGILGYVIARLSGKSYPDFMREKVFLPLGLTHTAVDLPAQLAAYEAVRYGSDGQPIPFYDFDHPGASAVYASAHDLVRFGMFHLKSHLPEQQAILPDRAIDEMQKPTVESGRNRGYGIGWATTDTSTGFRVVSHGGGMGGVSTVLQLVPARKLAVVVLTNCATPVIGRLSREIMNVLEPEVYGKTADPAPPAPAPAKPLPAELGGRWAGTIHTYAADLPFTLHIHGDNCVHARIGSQLLTLLNDARFENGVLAGRMNGDLQTDDANRRPYFLQVALKLSGDALGGSVTAISTPGKRVGNALTHWAELKKQ